MPLGEVQVEMEADGGSEFLSTVYHITLHRYLLLRHVVPV